MSANGVHFWLHWEVERQPSEIQNKQLLFCIVHPRMCGTKRMLYLLDGRQHLRRVEMQPARRLSTVKKNGKRSLNAQHYQYFNFTSFMLQISMILSLWRTGSKNNLMPSWGKLIIRSTSKGFCKEIINVNVVSQK